MHALEESADPSTASTPSSRGDILDRWESIRREMSRLLRQTDTDAAWLAALGGAIQALRDFAAREPDPVLYLLIEGSASELEHYSVRHSMLCAVVCELCARLMAWTEAEIASLVAAAVTMNIGMTAAQDLLARQTSALSPEQRDLVDRHPEASARMLRQAGVADPLWIEVVERHDQDLAPGADAPVPDRLVQLLRRIDIYTAKLSRRATRHAVSPAAAARDACLASNGVPDAVGATMLRSMGLYPPGSFVELANGEIAVVVLRGAKAHEPVVASLRRRDGGLLAQPTRRPTGEPGYGIVRGITHHEARVRLTHARVLAA